METSEFQPQPAAGVQVETPAAEQLAGDPAVHAEPSKPAQPTRLDLFLGRRALTRETEQKRAGVPSLHATSMKQIEALEYLPEELFVTSLTPVAGRVSHVTNVVAARLLLDKAARPSTQEEIEAHMKSPAWPRV